MSNLAAAFEGASQGLDQFASYQGQREMQEAMAMRAENLAVLRNALTTRRDLVITQARGNVLKAVSSNRISAEHAARDEEIDRQESGRAQNQASAQRRQLIDTERAQDNAFANQAELQARGQSRAARVQAARDAAVQANQARQSKAQIRAWLTKYQQQAHGATGLAGQYNPLDSQQLAAAARHDSVLAAQLQAYKEADAREQAAMRTMGKFPGPYTTPSTPGAVAPSSDPLASPPTSSLIPLPSEGPGIANQPYPAPSGAAEYMMSGDGDSSSDSASESGY